MNKTLHRLASLAAALASAALLSGCASTSLKGTPFYTGEYEKRSGPAEERVNLWPLLYYRDPALSVLWPIFEHTDDHLAMRPLFSVYRLHEERREYNVLWPLAQFDRKHADNRIFPLFWGDDYAALFPLYWHEDDPFGKDGRGMDALFPLWLFFNDRGPDYSLHLLWPFFQRKHEGAIEGGRLWPLYADWKTGASSGYSWYAWPLGWRWYEGERRNRLLLPLFYSGKDAESSTFASPLFGWHAGSDRSWNYLLPAGFHRETPEATEWYTLLGGGRFEPDGDRAWYAVPALAWGSRQGDRRDLWAAAGLYHDGRSADASSGHLLPLYYRSRSAEESLFLSLPYASHRDGEGRWDLVPPLWFHYADRERAFHLTPLYMRGTDLTTGEPWQAIPPLYYHRDDEAGDTFLSPLYGRWTGAGGSRHTLVPPALTYYRQTEARRDLWTLGGLGRFSWGEEPGSSYLFPFYYRSPERGSFVSPLWTGWRTDNGNTEIALVPPLLSWRKSDADDTTWRLFLFLAQYSRGGNPEPSWLLPLFYRDPGRDSFFSPFYAGWREGEDGSGAAVPLALSWYARTPEETRLRLLLGLYGHTRHAGRDPRSDSWLLPLYIYNRDCFLTLPGGRWKAGPTTFTYFPTPLFGWFSGRERGSWLFPLYCYSAEADGDRELYHLPWGYWTRTEDETRARLFPLYYYENQRPEDGAAAIRGRRWNILYLAAYENRIIPSFEWNRETKKSEVSGTRAYGYNRLFPLWRYERTLTEQTRKLDKDFALLFFLQDYQRRTDLADPAGRDYTRTRILWRLLHYERDHDTVSVDVFPAITYDRTGAEKRKVSFLWRGFRYERKEAEKAVDVLFLPVWRTAWAE